MDKSSLVLRSSIHPSLMRFVLWRGTSIAGLGIILLTVSGCFIPLSALKFWGFPIFLFSIALLVMGLLPYRRLKKLEISPYVLKVEHGERLSLFSENKPLCSFPLIAIAHHSYIERKHLYGICIELKTPSTSRPLKLPCDVFLPYFSKRAYEELTSSLMDEES